MEVKGADDARTHRSLWIFGTVLLSLAVLGVSCLLLHEGVSSADRLSGVPARMHFAIGEELGAGVTCLLFIMVQGAVNVVRRFGPAGKVKNTLLCVAVCVVCAAAFGTAAYVIVLRGAFGTVMPP